MDESGCANFKNPQEYSIKTPSSKVQLASSHPAASIKKYFWITLYSTIRRNYSQKQMLSIYCWQCYRICYAILFQALVCISVTKPHLNIRYQSSCSRQSCISSKDRTIPSHSQNMWNKFAGIPHTFIKYTARTYVGDYH